MSRKADLAKALTDNKLLYDLFEEFRQRNYEQWIKSANGFEREEVFNQGKASAEVLAYILYMCEGYINDGD